MSCSSSGLYLQIKGSRDERVRVTVGEMGPPVLNGAFSTFLSFILLAGSESHVFESFFKVGITYLYINLFAASFENPYRVCFKRLLVPKIACFHLKRDAVCVLLCSKPHISQIYTIVRTLSGPWTQDRYPKLLSVFPATTN